VARGARVLGEVRGGGKLATWWPKQQQTAARGERLAVGLREKRGR